MNTLSRRQHPLEVIGGGEVGGESRAADELRRRIGGTQLRVFVLERLQFAQQLVELGIGDDRSIPDVVPELVSTHLVGELLPATPQACVGRILGLFSQRGLRVGGRLRAHPGRLAEGRDTSSPADTLAPCRTRIMFRDGDPVLAKASVSAFTVSRM